MRVAPRADSNQRPTGRAGGVWLTCVNVSTNGFLDVPTGHSCYVVDASRRGDDEGSDQFINPRPDWATLAHDNDAVFGLCNVAVVAERATWRGRPTNGENRASG